MKAIEGQTWKLFEQEFLPLGKTYDYVIFDCPPGISPLSETARPGERSHHRSHDP